MEIKRDIHLNRIIARKGNGMIKVITGIRRCGKSYLLFTLFTNYLKSQGVDEQHIIKVDLEDRRNAFLRNPDALLKHIDSKFVDSQMHYILLDEVQLVPEFEDVLNSYLKITNADVYVTGSNSKFLSKDILTEFRGRGDEVHVLPLSFSEYYAFKQGDKSEAYDDYSVYGGLPAVALMATEEQKTNYLISQMQNLYLRDIVNRYAVQDETALGEVIDVIASGISTLTNPRKIANTMNTIHGTKTCDATVDRYIGYAEEAFILTRVKRYNVKGRKYIGTPYKIYFEDVGLRNVRLSFRQIEGTHMMENIIYNELRYRGYQVDVGTVESREKDPSGKEIRVQREIDFIASLGSKKYYIQSAYAIPDQEKYEQETKSFEHTMDSFKKIIIIEKSMKPRYDEHGYLMMGVKEFLLDANSLLI